MNQESNFLKDTSNWKTYGIALGIGIIATALGILLFSGIMVLFHLNRSLSAPFATVCVGLGSLISGFFAAYKTKSRGYLVGMLMGGIYFFLITAIALLVNKDGLSLNTLFHFIIIMLCGMIGGIAGVNRATAKKYL